MESYLARVFYFGDGFHGSQFQPNLRTVQGSLIEAISRWSGEDHNTTSVRLSGRTDRGVHSIGQLVHITTNVPFNLSGINKFLPLDVGVWAYTKVPNTYNPRRDVLARHYRYFLPASNGLDLQCMRQAAQQITGTHDFKFLSKRDGDRPTVTTILNVAVAFVDTSIMIEVFGTRFLWKLVRNIVTLLELVGLNEINLADVLRVVTVQDRLKSGIRPADPEGLFLIEAIVPYTFVIDKYAVRRMRKAFFSRLRYFRRSLISLNALYGSGGDKLPLV